MRRIAVALMALAAAMAGAAPAWGQRTGQAATANVMDPTPSAGASVAVEGEGWEGGSRLQIRFDDRLIGTTTVGVDGRFATEVRIPEDATEGEHVVTIRGQDEEGRATSLETPVTVTGATSPRGAVVVVALVAAALALILIVAAILLLRRRAGGRAPEAGGPSRQEPSPLEAGRRRRP